MRAHHKAAIRDRMRSVRARVARTSTAHDQVRDAIDENRGLFVKTRTQSLRGI